MILVGVAYFINPTHFSLLFTGITRLANNKIVGDVAFDEVIIMSSLLNDL